MTLRDLVAFATSHPEFLDAELVITTETNPRAPDDRFYEIEGMMHTTDRSTNFVMALTLGDGPFEFPNTRAEEFVHHPTFGVQNPTFGK